jgi:hypothetical protein
MGNSSSSTMPGGRCTDCGPLRDETLLPA